MRKKPVYLVLLAVLLLLVTLGPAYGFDANSDPGLVGWWKLDDGSGLMAVDASSRGNDGTLEGDPQWVVGWLCGALELDGDDHVDTGNAENLATYTFGVWAMSPAAPSSDAPSGPLHRENNYQISWNHSNETFRGTAAMNAGGWHAASFGTLEADTWYHLAASYDGEVFTSYKNGELITSNDAPSGPPNADSNTLKLGRHALAATQYFTGTVDDARVYSRALTEEEIQLVMLGGVPPELAADPQPENEAVDIARDVVLAWTAGESAATHDLYLGTSFDDVNNASRSNPMGVLVSQGQTATTYDPPGVLDFETTYYWRIDEVNTPPDNTIFKGQVWSFTSEPLAYRIENVTAASNGISDQVSTPERTVDGSGLNDADQHSTAAGDMWVANAPAEEPLQMEYEFGRVYKLHQMLVWNYNVQFELLLGFGVKDVTVAYSEDGSDWMALGDVQLNQGTAKDTYEANSTVDFGGVPAKYVRLTINSGWGMMGQYGLSEVRFLHIPAQAREPQPADGAADVDPATTLNWRAGREAVSHEVYLGTDPNALALAATVDQASYMPEDLEFGGTYYWQIIEVNEIEETPAWAGDVWNFSMQEYALIDGFETYNDDIDAGTAIFDTWIDGWVNNTGSTVGYFDAPFAERTIVHGGSQSMPLQYDNSASPFYSEAERTFETARNWQTNGADTLVLYVRGQAPAFAETADGSIIMSAVGTDIWDTSDQFRYAYKSLTGDGSIVVRVDSIVRSNEWAKAGVMIRETLDPGSAHAFVAVTPEPAHGVSFQRRPVAGQASANTDVADIEMPRWVKLTRAGDMFTAQQSADGINWVDITATTPVNIPMNGNVYIGLALTSHDAATVTASEFSNLSVTGNVTGDWQTAEIGAAQPQGNSAEPMYVRIGDAAGKSVTVTNEDAAITVRPSWQRWMIPYSDLSGVNLSGVEKMVIGIGTATAPAAGGTGMVYVDDVAFGKPATE